MNFLNTLFGGQKNQLTIRFSKSDDAWQVCNEGRIVYLGTKSGCDQYIRFMKAQ